MWPFTNRLREATSYTTKLQSCQSLEISNLEIFFWDQHLPPDRIRQCGPLRKISFLIWTPTSNFAGKRGSICQGLQLVECSSNQTLAHIMEGDRGAGAREKRGAPNEQKNWTRKWTRMLSFGKWTRMLSFGTVWKLHPGVWSSWLSWTLERYYEGWESGGKGAQKYGRRENVVREAEDSGPPVSPYPPPPLSRSNKEETFFFLFATNNVHRARKWSQKP